MPDFRPAGQLHRALPDQHRHRQVQQPHGGAERQEEHELPPLRAVHDPHLHRFRQRGLKKLVCKKHSWNIVFSRSLISTTLLSFNIFDVFL